MRSTSRAILRRRRPPRWFVGAAVVGILWAPVAQGQQEHKGKAPPARITPPARRTPVLGWEGVSDHGFTVAEESAREDALERLALRVGLLRLSTVRRVSDFVATSPAIGLAMRERYPGVAFSSPTFTADQICSVRAQVKLTDVIARLKALNINHGNGRFRDRDFDRMTMLNPIETLTAVGQGVPSLGDVPRVGQRRAAIIVPAWAGLTHREVGRGQASAAQHATAAGKLIAARRAGTEARRKLSEFARTLPLPEGNGVTVGGVLDRHPGLNTQFQAWLSQSRAVRTRWMVDGSAVVEVEAHLRPLWDIVAAHQGRRPVPDTRRTPVTPPQEQKDRSPSRR